MPARSVPCLRSTSYCCGRQALAPLGIGHLARSRSWRCRSWPSVPPSPLFASRQARQAPRRRVNRARRSIISCFLSACPRSVRAADRVRNSSGRIYSLRRILHVVILVIVLGLVERSGLDDLGVDRLLRTSPRPSSSMPRRASALHRCAQKIAVRYWSPRSQNCWSFTSRIDVAPENVEQLGEADLARVVDHLDRLGVAGAAGRDLL